MKGIVSIYLKEIQKIVAEGQKDGAILAGISPETVSVMFLGMVLPTAVIRNLTGGKFNVNRHIEKVWPIFKRGIAAYAPSPARDPT